MRNFQSQFSHSIWKIIPMRAKAAINSRCTSSKLVHLVFFQLMLVANSLFDNAFFSNFISRILEKYSHIRRLSSKTEKPHSCFTLAKNPQKKLPSLRAEKFFCRAAICFRSAGRSAEIGLPFPSTARKQKAIRPLAFQ